MPGRAGGKPQRRAGGGGYPVAAGGVAAKLPGAEPGEPEQCTTVHIRVLASWLPPSTELSASRRAAPWVTRCAAGMPQVMRPFRHHVGGTMLVRDIGLP